MEKEHDPEATAVVDLEPMVSNTRMAGFCRKQKSRCARAFVLGTSARERSEELFEGKEADVFRHTYALMIIDGMPADWVTEFGEQWEIWPGNSEKAKVADLQNNAVGRRVGAGVASMGFDPATAMKKAEVLVANMVRNHGTDLNFDF
jgi:hypothetical protein